MVTINNTFSGAAFVYNNEAATCSASGEYRVENDVLVSVNVNGQFTKNEQTVNFWANRDNAGNVNVSGVPASFLADVAAEVAEIISEVEAGLAPKKGSK